MKYIGVSRDTKGLGIFLTLKIVFCLLGAKTCVSYGACFDFETCSPTAGGFIHTHPFSFSFSF